MTQNLAEQFYDLFRGLDRAHGSFEITHSEAGKLRGKAFTRQSPVTTQLWEDHLAGKLGLGVVPLNDSSLCGWGVIDIDKKEYSDINHAAIERKINANKMPLVVCRSKSGDAHLFLFLETPIEAVHVRKTLLAWAFELGFPKAEIFPKQDKLAGENDVGNWLNMPYFDAKQTLRYGIKDGVPLLSAEEFVQYCRSKKASLDFLLNFKVACDPEFDDAPPCIQYYVKNKFTNNLNSALFSMGVFARQKFPDVWEAKIDEYNIRFMKPGTSKEVQTIVKSLGKKAYYYKCNDEPLRSQCNRVVCKTRKYGLTHATTDDIGIVIDGMQKLNTTPPIWFVNVQGTDGAKHRIELAETKELLNQRGFNQRCVDAMNFFPILLNAKIWRDIVQKALDTCQTIDAPAEASAEGALSDSLHMFLTGRAQGKSREDIRTNRPWLNDDDGFYYFKAEAFFNYIKQQGGQWYVGWTRQKFFSKLKDQGVSSDQLFGVGRVWKINSVKVEKQPEVLPTPNMAPADDTPF